MGHAWMKRLTSAFLVALCLGLALSVAAQTMPESDRDFSKQQVQRQVDQPGNNAPVWREVRKGDPQFTSIPGRETNVLIQPQGQTWRSLRNGEISVYGGWALVVVFLAIAAFYFVKGAIELHEPPTGRKVLRFTLLDRVIHWATAICFVILAVSGLIMLFGKGVLLPLIGYTLFSWLAILGKNLHNFVGPLFAVCLLLMFFNFVRENVPAPSDWQWKPSWRRSCARAPSRGARRWTPSRTTRAPSRSPSRSAASSSPAAPSWRSRGLQST